MTHHLPSRARMGSRASTITLVVLLAVLAAIGLAGCGSSSGSGSDSTSSDSGSSSSSGGSSSSSASGDADKGRIKLAQCLRDNGVDVPDDIGQGGGQAPQNIDRDKVQSLLQGACKDAAGGAFGDVSGDQQEEFRDAFAVYSQCMRDQGVDLPDMPSGGGVPDGNSIDRDDPSFQKAETACQDKLPQGLPGGGN